MEQSVLLIVDDNPQNLQTLGELLQADYRVRAANSGPRALSLATTEPRPSLILLDVMMPGMDGYEVLRRLKANPLTRDIPVIFVTAMGAVDDEQRGLAAGAVDYIVKPFQPAIVQARVRTHLELKRARDRLQDQNDWLEAEVARRMAENQLIQDVTIQALARLAEIRDNETGNHVRRTQGYVVELAGRLREHPRFREFLTPNTIELLRKSAPLHDIGKVGIPDEILLKPGKLDEQEWAVMKTHAAIGAQAIARAVHDVEQPVEFLDIAIQIARHHHERWNGSGYPDSLAGDEIPIPARLMALADVFDALISKRVYKPAMPFERARELISCERGEHFDPDMTDAFIDGFEAFCEIARRHADESETDR